MSFQIFLRFLLIEVHFFLQFKKVKLKTAKIKMHDSDMLQRADFEAFLTGF